MLLWCWPTGLGRSTGLDAGDGIRGGWVCWVRTSEQEDEADTSQVMVEHGHMLISEAAAQAVLILHLIK